MESGLSPSSPDAKGFRRLRVWHSADRLASAVFQTLKKRPVPPWLVSQVCRAALSVPANIAEGNARASLKDYIRFLDIAHASLAEVDYHLHFLVTNDLISRSEYEALLPVHAETASGLVALMRALGEKLRNGNWDRIAEETAEYAAINAEGSDLVPSSIFHLPGGEEG